MTAPIRFAALALLTCVALAAVAAAPRADVVGAWTLTYTTSDGVKLESVLTVTREGDKLTGTISSPRGSIALNEISVTGDDIAFAIIRVGFGDTIRIDYTGKVDGDSMKLTMKVGAREPLDVTAKRKARP
jgi:hypothetical protein